MEGERRQLLDAVMSASEKERSALASDLHDGPIQSLTALGFDLELALVSLEGAGSPDTVVRIQAAVADLTGQITSLRALMMNLRPPALDERGLAAALTDLVEDFGARSGVTCEVLVVPVDVPREVETLLYRAAQEAVANIRQHARARTMSLSLADVGGVLHLEIRDDGIGFDPLDLVRAKEAGQVGLASLVERMQLAGGSCEFDSQIGIGTHVIVEFSLESVAEVVTDASAAR
jgi:two-component system NarL family sensor kinase